MRRQQPDEKPTDFQKFVMKTSKMLLVGEIVRARSFLGEGTTPESYQLLKEEPVEELLNDSNILRAAVALARETEVSESVRRSLAASKAPSASKSGPLLS